VFTFHFDELGVQEPIGAELRQYLHDLGLRGDGIGRDNLGPGQLCSVGDGVVAHDHFFHFSSSSMDMA